MTIRRIGSLISFLLLCLCVWAQQDEKSGLLGFRVYVPDGEVVQGDRVQIVYELDATNYSIKSFTGGLEFGKIEKLDREKSEIEGARRIRVTATFKVYGAGKLRVKPMSATVDGSEVLSDEAVIDVMPNPKYGNQWQIAQDFLTGKGIISPLLAYKYGTETLCAFADDQNKCFVITASESYARYLDKPVLAYGMGNSMWNGERTDKDNTIYAILGQYERQLKRLRDKDEVYHSHVLSPVALNKDGVEPLLGDMVYGQDYPYNKYFPKEKYNGKDSCCIAGCGPVALAQTLMYYSNPVDLKGNTVLTSKSGKRYGIDLSDYPVRWDGSEKDIASLMIDCAGSVSAQISPYGTASSLSDFKSALINYWGYSPKCRMIEGRYNYDALTMILGEIDCGRPVILSDESHIFICDGYTEDYLHLNLGWGGHCNGYYRMLADPSVNENQLPFGSFLTGVRPLEKAVEMSVYVSEPGTLSTLLDTTTQSIVTKLVVTGMIDGEDLKCIRGMAGVATEGGYETGSLMNLDLSGATIKGGCNYLVRRADGIVLKGYQSNASGRFSYNYNMAEITDDDWAEITRRGLEKLESVLLFKGDDGHYYASYITTDNVIGDHMFSGCENLTGISLPANTKKIGSYAFHNCKALKSVSNRPATVSNTAFQNSGIKN